MKLTNFLIPENDTLFDILEKILDEKSLAIQINKILNTKVLLLIKHDNTKSHIIFKSIGITPSEGISRIEFEDALIKDILNLVFGERKMHEEFEHKEFKKKGVTLDVKLVLQQTVFRDVLYTSADIQKIQSPDPVMPFNPLELVILSTDEIFTSEDCYIAHRLLVRLNHLTAYRENVTCEKTRIQQFDMLKDPWMKERLPNISWKDLQELIRNYPAIDPYYISFKWNMYQIRKRQANIELFSNDSTLCNKIELIENPESFSSVRENDLSYLMYTSLTQNKFPLSNVVEFYESNMKLIESIILSSDLFTGDRFYSTNEAEGQSAQIMALYLEYIWKQVREDTSCSRRWNDNLRELYMMAENSENHRSLSSLIYLTHDYLLKALSNKSGVPDCGHGGKVFITLERRNLRLYFAHLILNSKKLQKMYLSKSPDKDVRFVPNELKRSYLLNLSRFILGCIRYIQEDLNLWTKHMVQSTVEELDALLYLVDRYVHIDLEVDERLNIRHHLARTVKTEVESYINRTYYRDHLVHVIDVFLLGHALLKTQVKWAGAIDCQLVDHLERIGHDPGNNEMPKLSSDQWLQNWALASLFHDIGYMVSQKNPVDNKNLWVEFLDFPSDQIADLNSILSEIAENLQVIVKLSKDELLQLIGDHGVASAFCLMKILSKIGKQKYSSSKPVLHDTNHGQYISNFNCALHAVTNHNLPGINLLFSKSPLTILLRLCDELQEWDRRRVNVEKVLKELYLDITGEFGATTSSFDIFKSMYSNIVIQYNDSVEFPYDAGDPVFIGNKKRQFVLRVDKPNDQKPGRNLEASIEFVLRYKDPVKIGYDPMIILLNKAYMLQFLDLSLLSTGQSKLKFIIDMEFPIHEEYGSLTEYDIYALFTESCRTFHLLRELDEMIAEGGLTRLPNTNNCDRFRITMQDHALPAPHRHGWIPENPDDYFSRYRDFKREFLMQHREKQ